jgi:hypothetical protein
MRIYWHTDLSAEECVARLKRIVEPPEYLEDYEAPLLGKVRKYGFTLLRPPDTYDSLFGTRYRQDSWAPVIAGHVVSEPHGTGSIIKGRIGVSLMTLVGVSIWLGLLGMLLVLFAIHWIAGERNPNAYFVAGLFTFGFVMNWLATRQSRAQEPDLLDFVRETLEATEQPGGSEN